MNTANRHNYYVYILANEHKSVLYIGVTNNLEIRVSQHKADALGDKKTFAGKYNCFYVVYMERHKYVNNAIAREKEIKGWTRAKKEQLINESNPNWEFLNKDW